MLSVFGDESADETKARVFAVVGVVGSDEQWKDLESAWLARTGGVPFHAKNCESDQGDYATCLHADNQALYKDLTILLAESGMGGWGVSLDLIAQNRTFPGILPDHCYYKGFIEVIEKMKNCAAFNREQVKFTFDTREESEYNAGKLYGMAKDAKQWNQFIADEISFACSRKNPKIQVADLFAREAMKVLDNRIGPKKRPPRKSWLCLSDTKRFHVDILSDEWFEGLKKDLPRLEKEIGMSMEDYAGWLIQTNKRVDNMSNRLEYISFAIERDGQ